MIEIKLKPNEFRKAQKMLVAYPGQYKRILNRAATSAAGKMRTLGRKMIRQASGLPGKFINPMVQKFKPRGAAIGVGYLNPAARASVFKLVHSQSGGGVTYIGPDKREEHIAGGFDIESLKGTFTRKGPERFPIRKMYHTIGEESLDGDTRQRISQDMLDEGATVLRANVTRLTHKALEKAAK